MVPNEPTTIEFALQDVFHTLDFRSATMRIHHSKSQPSSITFGVLPGGAVVP